MTMWPFTLAFRSSAPLMAFERFSLEELSLRIEEMHASVLHSVGHGCSEAGQPHETDACRRSGPYACSLRKLCSCYLALTRNAHWWHDCYAQDAGARPAALGGGGQRREGRRLRFGLTLGEIGVRWSALREA